MTKYEFLENKKRELEKAYASAVKNRLPDMANLWLAKKHEITQKINGLTVMEAEREYKN